MNLLFGPATARQQLQARTQNLSPVQQATRSNLMSLINLRGASRAPAAAGASVDVVVHGTGRPAPDWSQPGASFAQRVRAGRNAVSTSFNWSGSRLEAGRQAAGDQLAGFLRDMQNPQIAGPRDTNVIAHSHGGNVLGHALSRNNVRIDNAVMLATPAMSQGGNPNVSWTPVGANRVRNAIMNFSAPDDIVQTGLAQANEWAQGRFGIRSGRDFSRPASTTPQFNVSVRQPESYLGGVRDAALGLARLNTRLRGHRRVTAAALTVAGSAELKRRVDVHTEMHNDRVGNLVGASLTALESKPVRTAMAWARFGNFVQGHTAPVNRAIRFL